jgi:predicted RecA/RadA family phage recombinase
MARNYVQPGKTLTLVAPYQRNAGEGALVGALFGVALQTVANAVAGEFAIEGVWTITKNTGEAWTQGALIYWDNTNKRCTTTSTSNTRIGCAAVAAGSADTTGVVRLNGIATPTGA